VSSDPQARERTTDEPEALGGAPAGDDSPAPEGSPASDVAPAAEGAPAPEGDPAAPEPAGEEPAPARAREPKGPPPPPERLEGAVEALLLSAGETLTAERIRDVLGLPSAVHVREALVAIRARWQAAGTAVEIQDVAGGHRVVTRPEYAEYVRRLQRRPTADRLSPSLLETLSIVAYRQPVARAEVERIRGVQCGEALRGLLDRRLVKVAGRSDQPGRPLLYATTTRFLETFGISTLEDLPNAKDLSRL
jgi:segregation and condensation protein B